MWKDKGKAGNGKSLLGKMSDTFRGVNKSNTRPKLSNNDPVFSASMDSRSNSEYDIQPLGSVSASSTLNTSSYDDGESLDALTDEQIESMFESFIEDLNLTGDKAAPLRAKSMVEKLEMLRQMNRTNQAKRGGKVKSDSPSDYIHLLNIPPESLEKLQDILESLRVALASNPLSWIQQFGARGLTLLLDHLKTISKEVSHGNPSAAAIQLECIRCLRAFMNNRHGFLKMFEHEKSCITLVHSMNIANLICMTETMKLLAAMCVFTQDGENICFYKVLDAFTIVGEMEEQERFLPIILGLHQQTDLQLQASCLQLVNAILNAAEDTDFRIHLRSELMRTGLVDVLEMLDESDKRLSIQINIFKGDRDHDYEEMLIKGDNIRSAFDGDHAEDCMRLLENILVDTPAYGYYISILQHLLMIRSDVKARAAYFALIEECVSQIVLFKNGCDPDFRAHKRFHLNVDELIEKIIESGAANDTGEGFASKALSKKLDAAVTSRQELEAKLLQCNSKFEEYQKEVDGLRAHIGTNGQDPLPPKTTPPPVYRRADWDATTPVSSAPPPPPPPPPPPTVGGPPPPPPLPGAGPCPPPPPPPPPPIGGGIPRPPGAGPPPPPPPPGLGGFRPPAPPAAATLPDYLKPKSKYHPDGALKKLNWKTVTPNQLASDAFWAKTQEDRLGTKELFSQMNQLFASNTQTRKAQDNMDEAEDASTKKIAKKAKKLRVLDSKSAQALAILQASLKMSHDELKRAILSVDENRLTESLLQQLVQSLPDNDILKQISEIKDPREDLAEAEQFAMVMGSINKLKPRLNAIGFKLKFDECVGDIKPNVVAVTAACEEIRGSKGFACFLELTLLVGNYMNSSGNYVGTYAFDLKFLTKIVDIKSNDNRRSLLHVLAETLARDHPKMANFTEEFIHISAAARVSPDILQKNLASMQQSVKQLDQELRTFQPQDENDRFKEALSTFYDRAKEECSLLETMHKNMLEIYKNLAKYFSFDSQKYSFEEFFGDIKTFKDQYDHAVADLQKLRETEEKIRRAQEARIQTNREKEERKLRQKAIDNNAQTGVMDNLLEALSSGQAFSQRVKTPIKGNPHSGERRNTLKRQRSRAYAEHNMLQSMGDVNFGEGTVRSWNSNVSKLDNESTGKQPQMRVRRKGQPTVDVQADFNGNLGTGGGGSNENRTPSGDGSTAHVNDLLERLNAM